MLAELGRLVYSFRGLYPSNKYAGPLDFGRWAKPCIRSRACLRHSRPAWCELGTRNKYIGTASDRSATPRSRGGHCPLRPKGPEYLLQGRAQRPVPMPERIAESAQLCSISLMRRRLAGLARVVERTPRAIVTFLLKLDMCTRMVFRFGLRGVFRVQSDWSNRIRSQSFQGYRKWQSYNWTASPCKVLSVSLIPLSCPRASGSQTKLETGKQFWTRGPLEPASSRPASSSLCSFLERSSKHDRMILGDGRAMPET